MQQGELIHNGTDTSRQAALMKHEKGTAAKDRARIYSLILHAPEGLTRKEIQRITGLDGDSVRPRVWELCGNGGLYPMPLIKDHPTMRRDRCAVLVIANASR